MPKKIDETIFERLAEVLYEGDASAQQAQEELPPWEPPLSKTQKKIFDCPARWMLVSGPRGTGKCLEKTTRVWTDKGLVRIGDFCEKQEEGFHPLATPVNVTAFSEPSFLQGTAPFFYREPNRQAKEVCFENGHSLTGSPRHPLWTECEGSIRWRTTTEVQELLAEGKPVYSPIKVGHEFWETEPQSILIKNRWQRIRERAERRARRKGTLMRRRLPDSEAKGVRQSSAVIVNQDVAYLVGALVGDGCLVGDNMRLTSTDPSLFEETRATLSECFFARWVREKGDRYSCRVVGGDGLFRDFLDRLGLLGKKSHDKFIPEVFFQSPKKVAASFLSGLFDTDGTVDSRSGRVVSLNTVSYQLAKDTHVLLNALGVFSSIYTKNRKSGLSYDVVIVGDSVVDFCHKVGFRLRRKQEKVKLGLSHNANKFTYPPSIVREMKEVLVRSPLTKKGGRDRMMTAVNAGYVPSFKRLSEFVKVVGSSPRLARYRLPDCRWVKITEVKDTEADLCDLGVEEYHSFVAEGFVNHNTWGILHKLVRHLYEEQNALALIVVGIRSQATQGGAWEKLILETLPIWGEAIGLEYTEEKRDEQQYRYVFVKNRHGGYSKVTLMSLPWGTQVKDRIKGFEPSMIFVDELVTLGGPEYFTALIQQLGRRPGIEGPQQYIAATNPDGPSHWVYKRFFETPFKESKDDNGKVISPEGEWDPRYAKFVLGITENRHNLPPGYYEQVMEATSDDPIERRRMVEGEWIDRPSGDSLFEGYFSEEMHVIKGPKGRRVLPSAKFPVVLGYDLGQTSNAIVFIQPIVTKAKGIVWLIFDELVITNKKIPYELLVKTLMRKMRSWEQVVKTKFTWFHVSDDSAFSQYRAGEGSYDHLQVMRASEKFSKEFGIPPIKMVPAPKFKGSVEARVRITMNLLQEGRLLASSECKKVKEMFFNLQSEKTKEGNYDPTAPFKPKRSVHLHPFDAISYVFLEADLGRPRYVPAFNMPKVEIVGKKSA